MDLTKIISADLRHWHADWDAAAESERPAIAEMYAAKIGLPVLAALYQLAGDLPEGPINRARLLTRLHEIIATATGEANVRLERLEIEERLPGVPVPTMRVL